MPARYHILRMETIGTPPLIIGGTPATFDDPAIAAAHARVYSKNHGEKMCVKPVVDDEWRIREEGRIINGTYRQLPWAAQGWWTSHRAYVVWKDHFAHASLEKPGWIAFTKNEGDGMKDKQTLLRPGAYLKRYFEDTLAAYHLDEQQLVKQFMKMYGPIDVQFANTEADVIKVYDCLTTCLAGKRWVKNIHPATLYLAGDLQIAYIGNLEANKVSARTLVWPERKIHSRVYGDIARLTQGLERLGYKWGAPIGARIKRVQLHEVDFNGGDAPSQCFLAPYIDKRNQQGGGHLAVMDRGDHLMICAEGEPGSHHCGQADGTSGLYVPKEDEYPTYYCDHCEKDGVRQVFEVFTATDEDGDGVDPEMWCGRCRDDFSWCCCYSQNNFHTDVGHISVGGTWWLTRYAEMYAAKCEGYKKLYPKNRLKKIHFGDGSVKNLSDDYIANNVGRLSVSQLTKAIIPSNELAILYDMTGNRIYCSKRELKSHAFQCDGCKSHWMIEWREQPYGDDRLFCPVCAKIEAKQLRAAG